MNRQLLKEVVIEQNKRLASVNKGIPREDLSVIQSFYKLPHAVVIAGLRRAGKSTLLYQIMAELGNQGYYFNFEDERLIGSEVKDFTILHEILMELYGKRTIFFLDEIQNVHGWERFVRRMTDSGYKFFLTGSNASLLSQELGTKLTGRHISHVLFPFSFREYLLFCGTGKIRDRDLLETDKRALLKQHFNRYLYEGGMPEYLAFHQPETLKSVYDDILFRDIATRYDIRDIQALRELAIYLLSNAGTPVTYNRLAQFLHLGSVNTARSYIRYLENSFLFFLVNQYDPSLKKQSILPKKVYAIDNGMVYALAFKFSENVGRLIENLVFLELKRRKEIVYYYRTQSGLEVDFLLIKGSNIDQLVQVSSSLAHPKTRERELNALQEAMGELGVRKGLILTMDETEKIKVEKKRIIVKPVYEWLLTDY